MLKPHGWTLSVSKISDVSQVRKYWKWVIVPPPDVIKEFIKGYNCIQCRRFTGPFLFIGKYPSPYQGWVGFQKPTILLKNGDVFAILARHSPC